MKKLFNIFKKTTMNKYDKPESILVGGNNSLYEILIRLQEIYKYDLKYNSTNNEYIIKLL